MVAVDDYSELKTTADAAVPARGPALWRAARASRARAVELRARSLANRTHRHGSADVAGVRASGSGARRPVGSSVPWYMDPRWDRLLLRQERAANTALQTRIAQLIQQLTEAEAEISACNAELRAMNREVQLHLTGHNQPLRTGGRE